MKILINNNIVIITRFVKFHTGQVLFIIVANKFLSSKVINLILLKKLYASKYITFLSFLFLTFNNLNNKSGSVGKKTYLGI